MPVSSGGVSQISTARSELPTQRGTWPRERFSLTSRMTTGNRRASRGRLRRARHSRARRGVGELLAPRTQFGSSFGCRRGVRSGLRLGHGGVARGVVASDQASATVFRRRVRERGPDGVYHPPPRQEDALSRAETPRRAHARAERAIREPHLHARGLLRRRGSSTRTARWNRVGSVRDDVDVHVDVVFRVRGKRRKLFPLEAIFPPRAPGTSPRGDPRGGNARGPRGCRGRPRGPRRGGGARLRNFPETLRRVPASGAGRGAGGGCAFESRAVPRAARAHSRGADARVRAVGGGGAGKKRSGGRRSSRVARRRRRGGSSAKKSRRDKAVDERRGREEDVFLFGFARRAAPTPPRDSARRARSVRGDPRERGRRRERWGERDSAFPRRRQKGFARREGTEPGAERSTDGFRFRRASVFVCPRKKKQNGPTRARALSRDRRRGGRVGGGGAFDARRVGGNGRDERRGDARRRNGERRSGARETKTKMFRGGKRDADDARCADGVARKKR